MRLVFTSNAWQDYTYWQPAGRATLKRINRLTDDVLRDLSEGTGKPEPLRLALTGTCPGRSAKNTASSLVGGDDIVILRAR